MPGALRGLFCGGTLADEAMLVAAEALGDIASNIPLRPDLALGADLRSPGHVVIDFGDDSLTQGRAHPMIDPTLRMERIAAEAADPTSSSGTARIPTRPESSPTRSARRGPPLQRTAESCPSSSRSPASRVTPRG